MNFSELIKSNKDLFYNSLTPHQLKIFKTLEQCRTSVLGAHAYYCPECEKILLMYNSCRNRNCPVCQGNKRRQWVENQKKNLVNVPYFHVVFTVPEVLNSIFLQNPVKVYNTLYHSAWETLQYLFENKNFDGGKGGMLCILHTWGQTLSFHPHLHCLVPGAVLNKNGDLKVVRSEKFLFPVFAMAKIFRAKFAEKLTVLVNNGEINLSGLTRRLMFAKKWVVFSKAPFASPEIVVNYIGLYTHRIALSQNRILDNTDGKITFSYKDYKNKGIQKTMTLDTTEFFRRFSMHILPHQFRKIRSYGVLSNTNIKAFISKAGEQLPPILPTQQTPEQIPEEKILQQNNAQVLMFIDCPYCKTGIMHRVFSIGSRQAKAGVKVINIRTAEIVFSSRAGPENALFQIIEVEY